MTKKRNLQVSTSPSVKKQKSLLQKKTLLKVTSKRTSEPKFLLGLKRFLIQGSQNGKIHKKKSGGIETVRSSNKSKVSISTKRNRKCMSSAKSPPLLSIQASRDGSRKRKYPAKTPPLLPIQASSDDDRQRESPAESPPVLSNQNQNFQAWQQDGHELPEVTSRLVASSPNQNSDAWEQVGHDLPDVTSRVVTPSSDDNSEAGDQDEHDLPDVTSSPDQNSEAWEQDRHYLPDVTSRAVTPSPCAAPHMNRKKKILRESNALCPAKVMPAHSYSANVRMGFDRNLKPQKIVKMAEYRGKDYFIMKWKGSEIMDIVPTEVAKERCPQIVIAFYEKHLTNVHNRDLNTYE